MKRKIFAAFLGFSATHCFAQEQLPTLTHVTKATFLNPGISYERALGKRQTLYTQAYLNTSAYFMYSEALGSSAGIYFNPAFTAQYRFYYNLAKRQSAGKRTELNSGNYISPVVDIMLAGKNTAEDYEVPTIRPVYTAGVVWGLQRNYLKRFSLDLNLGLGYYSTKRTMYDIVYGEEVTYRESDFTAIGQINLGFWLNKRRD